MNITDKIIILEAYKEGKDIEYMSPITHEWTYKEVFLFNFGDFEYRIKPKTRKLTMKSINKLLGFDVEVVE